jgi:hypothetical protein
MQPWTHSAYAPLCVPLTPVDPRVSLLRAAQPQVAPTVALVAVGLTAAEGVVFAKGGHAHLVMARVCSEFIFVCADLCCSASVSCALVSWRAHTRSMLGCRWMTKMLSECSRGCNATVVRSVFINMVLHIVRCPHLHTDHRYTGTAVVAHHNGLCVGACCRLCVVLIPTLCPPLWWRVIELRWLSAPAAALASAHSTRACGALLNEFTFALCVLHACCMFMLHACCMLSAALDSRCSALTSAIRTVVSQRQWSAAAMAVLNWMGRMRPA